MEKLGEIKPSTLGCRNTCRTDASHWYLVRPAVLYNSIQFTACICVKKANILQRHRGSSVLFWAKVAQCSPSQLLTASKSGVTCFIAISKKDILYGPSLSIYGRFILGTPTPPLWIIKSNGLKTNRASKCNWSFVLVACRRFSEAPQLWFWDPWWVKSTGLESADKEGPLEELEKVQKTAIKVISGLGHSTYEDRPEHIWGISF